MTTMPMTEINALHREAGHEGFREAAVKLGLPDIVILNTCYNVGCRYVRTAQLLRRQEDVRKNNQFRKTGKHVA